MDVVASDAIDIVKARLQDKILWESRPKGSYAPAGGVWAGVVSLALRLVVCGGGCVALLLLLCCLGLVGWSGAGAVVGVEILPVSTSTVRVLYARVKSYERC